MTIYDDSVACRLAAGFETAMRLMKVTAVKDARLFARAGAFRNEERILFFIKRGANLLNDRLVSL
jgi:hypothetical protein